MDSVEPQSVKDTKGGWLKSLKNRKSTRNLHLELQVKEEKHKNRSTFTAPSQSQTSSLDSTDDTSAKPLLRNHPPRHRATNSSDLSDPSSLNPGPLPSPLPSPTYSNSSTGSKNANKEASTPSNTIPSPTSATSITQLQSLSPVSRQQRPINSDGKQYASLLSRDTFRKILDDPVGLFKFGTFLASELGAEQLCFWLNAEQHRSDLARLQSLSRRLHDLHVPSSAPLALNISSSERRHLQQRVAEFSQMADPFAQAREASFASMQADAWPRFIKHRLNLAQNMVYRTDLPGENANSYCLTDVGSDQQILMTSDGFSEMYGYSLEESLNRNCRFVQGPGTSKSAMARIRTACRLGLPSQELLLNYKKDGAPIWTLLRIEPLRDASGELRYFLGHQFNVSSKTSDLSYLLSDALDEKTESDDSPMVAEQQSQAQEAMKSHISVQLGAAERRVGTAQMQSAANDRDRRMKDATALAFEATNARPNSRGRSSNAPPAPVASSGPRPTSAAGWNAGRLAFTKPRSAETGRKEAFGAMTSMEERKALSGITQIGELEGEAQWQSEALARFCFVEPRTAKILFSSVALPVDWAQNESMLTAIAKLNSEMVGTVRAAIQSTKNTKVELTLQLMPEPAPPSKVILSIAPLLLAPGVVGGVVCMFSL